MTATTVRGDKRDEDSLSGEVAVQPQKLRRVRPRELAIRFAFGAAIAVVAGIMADAIGPRGGGLFLAFPAVLPASLTLIEGKEGKPPARHDAHGGIFGGIGLGAFALVVLLTITRLQPVLSLLGATGAWLAVSFGFFLLFHGLLHRGPLDDQED